MIECSNENIYYKKKRKLHFKFPFYLFVFLIIFLSYYRFFVTKKIVQICKEYSYSICAECVNNAVILSLSNGLKYSEIINVEKNSNGDINLISLNSVNANSIARDTIKNTKIFLNDMLSEGVPLPFFAFLGFDFISGYGKVYNYKFLSISSVNNQFISQFKSVGINQTLHSIYINIICKVAINVPMAKNEEIFETRVLLSESVLVGKVPEIYLSGNLNG